MIEVDIAVRRGAFSLEARFVSPAGLTALFGPSGSGKSTLIAALAGLVRPTRGRIAVDGAVLFDAALGIDLPVHRRRIGLVFQDGHLLPHLSVRANLAYGRWFSGSRRDAVAFTSVVDTLGLGALLDRRPAGLSGGERQRVALGRAVLARPRLLLMDEPLAALDRARRLDILPLIERLRDDAGIPILYVSHAPEEVARLAGLVVPLAAGHTGLPVPPGEAFRGRQDADRCDVVSVMAARVGAYDERYGLTRLDHPAGFITVPGRTGLDGSAARVVVRGSDVSLALEVPHGLSLRTVLAGTVEAVVADGHGPIARVDLALPGGDRLSALVTRQSVDDLDLAPGRPVHALIKAASVDDGAGR